MSTSRETGTHRVRPDDRLVTVISAWLARHLSDEELRQELDRVGANELEPEQAVAAGELREELIAGGQRAELEMVARETLEALALGG